MLKIRRPLGRLIFNMGIAIPGKTVFLIETAPWSSCLYIGLSRKHKADIWQKYKNKHNVPLYANSSFVFNLSSHIFSFKGFYVYRFMSSEHDLIPQEGCMHAVYLLAEPKLMCLD